MFARRPILDRHPVQNLVVVAALVISAVMFTPAVSPVLGTSNLIAFVRSKVAPPVIPHFGTIPVDHLRTVAEQPVQAKGILMTGYTAGSQEQWGGHKFDDLRALIKRTELNAAVIDVKDERGEISWLPRTPMARMAGAGLDKIRNPKATVKRLHDDGVYVIGRIVTFQDPIMAKVRPDLALQDTHGGVWKTAKGRAWLDPYSVEAQDYNIALAVEALELGFDEIQFDYVRFPSDGDLNRLWSRFSDERSHSQVIADFLGRARKEIHSRGAFISADAFGLTALVHNDLGIGQEIELMARQVDYMSLMLYPSHYNKPEYGIPDPELQPGLTVALSMRDALRRIAGTGAQLRPWLQDFTLRTPYTPREVLAQIQAVEQAGVHQWLLWNATNRYREDALRPAPGATGPPPPSDSSVSG